MTRDQNTVTRMLLVSAAVVTLAAVGLLCCSTPGSPIADPLLALADVAAQRVQLADTVAAAKWGTDAPIDDPVREQAVLDAVAATRGSNQGSGRGEPSCAGPRNVAR